MRDQVNSIYYPMHEPSTMLSEKRKQHTRGLLPFTVYLVTHMIKLRALTDGGIIFPKYCVLVFFFELK